MKYVQFITDEWCRINVVDIRYETSFDVINCCKGVSSTISDHFI